MRVEYHPALESELKETRDYYSERSAGLGGEFVSEFERQILRIAEMPERWRIIERDIRRSLMKRFPYVIYYRILQKDLVRVLV